MKNIPKLRFPEFVNDGEWEEKYLAQIIDFKSGYAFSSSSMSNDVQQYQLIKMSNVYQNILALDRNPSYWQKINKSESEFLLNQGDVVLTLTGTIGKKDYGYSVMIEESDKFLLNQRLVRLRAIDGISISKFIRNLVLNERFLDVFFINSRGGTGNQSNVSIEDLKQIKLPIPERQEQQKIADCLSSVDSLISAQSKKVELLKEHKKALMQQLFPQDTEEVPKLRFPEFKNAPKWEEKSLGSLCSTTTGKLDANAMVENGQYRFYTCAKNYYFIDNYAFDTEALLISGNGANVGYIHYYQGKFNAYQRTYVLDEFSENIIFIKYHLEQNLHKRIATEKKEGNTPYIVMSTLTDMTITLPKLDEQQKIADCLSSIDEQISSQTKKLETLREHKKALMQQLFPSKEV